MKIIVDDGKPMRLQAFLFLETALEKPTNQAFAMLGLHPQILLAALDRIGSLLSNSEDEKDFGMFLQRLTLIKILTTQAPEAIVGEAAKFKTAVAQRILQMDPEARYARNVLECFSSIYRNTIKDFSSEIE